jgi:hypothetical protein
LEGYKYGGHYDVYGILYSNKSISYNNYKEYIWINKLDKKLEEIYPTPEPYFVNEIINIVQGIKN